MLLRELTHAGDRESMWMAADVGLALVAQLVLGLTLAWSLRGSLLRLLVVFPGIPLLTAGLNLAYLVSIPSYFLIEPDTAPERTDWEEHCFVHDVSLTRVRTPVTQSAGRTAEWWVQRPSGRYALLRLPSCSAIDARLPVPELQPGGRVDFTLGLQYSVPGGAAIFERYDMNSQQRSWWLLADPMAPLAPIAGSELQNPPVLSNAGDAVAWVERVAGSSPAVLERLVVLPVDPSRAGEINIELAPFGAASYVVLEVDTVAREVVLWRNDAPLVVGFDGSRRDTTFTPGSMQPQSVTYLRRRDGWVAWDAYREDGPYQLSWSLAAGSGLHRATKGRTITAAAVDPTGRFIAISETTALSIGDAPDVVYVIRTADGADVFRKYLPRYSRSQVVFFDGGLFAYSELRGTHVLRVEDAPIAPQTMRYVSPSLAFRNSANNASSR
jgi:hypothetical protein